MILRYLSVSDLMKRASSSGVEGETSTPVLIRNALTSASFRIRLSSSLSFATTLFGVLAGTRNANQMLVSNP